MFLWRRIALWLCLFAVLAHGGFTAVVPGGASAWPPVLVGADESAQSLDRALALSFCGRAPHRSLVDDGRQAPASPLAPCLDCCCPAPQITIAPEFASTPAIINQVVARRYKRVDRKTAAPGREWRLPPARAPPVTA